MKTLKYLLTVLLCLTSLTSYAEEKGKEKDKEKADSTQTKKSDYDKLFSARHEVAEGMITLHLVKGKVYFEMPLDLMGRDMMIGSTITEISDNGNAIVGSKPTQPRHVKFTMNDKNVQLREMSSDFITDDPDSPIATAVKNSNIGAILKNMKISAWSPDSTAVVFDMTSFFVSDDKKMLPFDNFSYYTLYGYERSQSFKSDKSYVSGIKAFQDNVTVSSTLSYDYSLKRKDKYLIQNEPFTAVVTRSVVLLDEKPYRSRIGDSRMSVFPTAKAMLESGSRTGIKDAWYSNRWKLEPSDPEAYIRGELVEPKKQIVFYVDNNFPESWKAPIKEGVNQWNEMFETIGFKNAIAAKDFPTPEEDPEFDPDNLKYSCVRYAPIGIANAMGPSWVDPRSGEIFTASVYIYHDIVKLLRNWMFVQISPADKSIRHTELPEDVFYDGLRYVVAHEIGHCLGYMHNMSASYQIPVDSLRSPSYTQKYGTTTSIMDYARFNYVAQPGDKERGVRLTPPRFGVYDQYAVKWLYTAFPDKTQEEETEILMKWLQDASKDPVYTYGKQLMEVVDPRSQTEDLGDDVIKATKYGMKNLQYLMKNYNSWVADEDEDFEFRTEIYNAIINQYVTYANHLYSNIGGVYLKDVKVGDEGEPYTVIPEERQREVLNYLLSLVGTNEWFDNEELLSKLPVMGSAAARIDEILCNAIINLPFKVARYGQIGGGENYSFEECLQDVYDFVWKPAGTRKLTKAQMYIQDNFVKVLAVYSGVVKQNSGNANGITDETFSEESFCIRVPEEFAAISHTDAGALQYPYAFNPVAGYGGIRQIFAGRPTNQQSTLYGYLLRSQKVLKKAASSSKGEVKAHYQYLADFVETALESK